MSRVPQRVAEAVLARSGGNCEAMVPRVCVMVGHHFHHRRMRSQGGADTTHNLVHVCHACHEWIHSHPKLAYEDGLLVRSTSLPENVSLRRRGRWVALDSDGGFTLFKEPSP